MEQQCLLAWHEANHEARWVLVARAYVGACVNTIHLLSLLHMTIAPTLGHSELVH
jgi:hypothetical protein